MPGGYIPSDIVSQGLAGMSHSGAQDLHLLCRFLHPEQCVVGLAFLEGFMAQSGVHLRIWLHNHMGGAVQSLPVSSCQ